MHQWLFIAYSAALIFAPPVHADESRLKETATPNPLQTEAPPLPSPAVKPRMRPKQASQTPGIYPVYETQDRWIIVDRFAQGSHRSVAPGSSFLVVGSRAAGLFTASKSSVSLTAACVKKTPAATPIFFLSGRGKARIGTPIIAISVSNGKRIDPRQARFSRLENRVGEDFYAAWGEPLKQATVDDVLSGNFAINADDAMGRYFAQNPKPDRIQLKIDFGSALRLAGAGEAFVLVEGSLVSKIYRRCLRLFVDNKLAGQCAEMPHTLMAETNLLDFVAYDPTGKGRPFVLAYTPREPMWGHERWGFRLTAKGPQRFLMDALDPKCRDRW